MEQEETEILIYLVHTEVERAMLTVERVLKSLDVICAHPECRLKFGEHKGLNCPNGKTTFKEVK